MLNDDDDNGNSQADLSELVGPIEHEDDLEQLEVGYWLREDAYADDYLAYFYTLSPNIRLWTTSDKQEEIIPFGEYTTGREFTLAELPGEIWVEGIARGTASLSLNIYGPSSSLFTDMVHPPGSPLADTLDGDHVGGGIHGGPGFTAFITSMQVGAGLTAYRPMQPTDVPGLVPFPETRVSDGYEWTVDRGPGLRINGDNDDNDTMTDVDPEDTSVPGENDLIKIQIDGAPSQDDLKLRRNNDNIRVWSSSSKGTLASFDEDGETNEITLPASGTQVLYVEWGSLQHADTNPQNAPKLELIDINDPNNPIDTLVFHTFQSIVVGFSGETTGKLLKLAMPANEQPTYNMAFDLYREHGYDVYYYDVARNSVNAAVTETVAAINKRGVSHVAAFGWSHGGGAAKQVTHNLALLSIGNQITKPFAIDATAYIDAVKYDPLFFVLPRAAQWKSENTRPLYTLSGGHANWYQTSGLIHGTKLAQILPNDGDYNWTQHMTKFFLPDHIEVAELVRDQRVLVNFVLNTMPER